MGHFRPVPSYPWSHSVSWYVDEGFENRDRFYSVGHCISGRNTHKEWERATASVVAIIFHTKSHHVSKINPNSYQLKTHPIYNSRFRVDTVWKWYG